MLLRILLFPFAILYDLATRIRNYVYDAGWKKTKAFAVPLICVGNVSVGGTGKTPMIEYIVGLLQGTRVATLSRGYGRATHGFRIAGPSETAATLGDEPFQFYRKLGKEITVAVGEDRAKAVPAILNQFPDTQAILLDDAFQHRAVRADLNILLTTYAAPFFEDFVLPAGRLREARRGASRADLVVVTKCDGVISEDEMNAILERVKAYAGEKPVFFTTIRYSEPQAIGHERSMSRDVILVSGIAQAGPFEDYARRHFNVVRHFQFGDHHLYTPGELTRVVEFVKGQRNPVSVLTTEKDAARIVDPKYSAILSASDWFYLPIETVFLKNGAEFDELIRRAAGRSRGA